MQKKDKIIKLFDKSKQTLFCVGKQTNPTMWDELWQLENNQSNKSGLTNFNFVVYWTKKIVKNKKAKIFEGGCGSGNNIKKLRLAGFDVLGCDTASKTLYNLKKINPDLQIIEANVKSLPIKTNSLDAYWSLGVIEHEINSYDKIIDEVKRVLMPGGIFFLTFPHINLMRKIKIFLKCYKEEKIILCDKIFYQKILDSNIVYTFLSKKGFICLRKIRLAGFKGLKDELAENHANFFQKIYNLSNTSFFWRGFNQCIDFFLTPFFSHSVLIICKKNKNN